MKTAPRVETPLQVAAKNGCAVRCRELIAAGADANEEVAPGSNLPLQIAAQNGYTEVCEVLLGGGARIDGRGSDLSLTPLLRAALTGHRDTALFLIERGADITLVGGAGRGLALLAANGGNVDLCEDLVALGIGMGAKDDLGFGALHVISRPNGRGDLNFKLLEFLVVNGVDPNEPGKDGYGPLDYAIRSRDFEVCRELVKLGAETDLITDPCKHDYLTPFQKAVYCGFDKAVEFFVAECGEDPAQRTLDGRTMVQLARNYPETKTLLRSLKAAFDVEDSLGSQNNTGAPADRGAKISGLL